MTAVVCPWLGSLQEAFPCLCRKSEASLFKKWKHRFKPLLHNCYCPLGEKG